MLLQDLFVLRIFRNRAVKNYYATPKGRNRCHEKLQLNILENSWADPGRSTRFTFFREGSMTLEAAIVLPLFLMVISAFLSFFSIMMVELKLQNAMNHAGKQLSAYYYAMDRLLNNHEKQNEIAEEIGASIAIYAASETVVREQVLKEAGSIPDSVVVGGSGGLSFMGSRFDQSAQDVIICVTYQMSVPFLPPGLTHLRVGQQCRHRAWTGSNEDVSAQEQYVYVTEYGSVYHTSISCSYIKLSISQVAFNMVGYRRNEGGGKYYPCELCGKIGGSIVYITNYGDRYHFNRNCSGLKRGIRCIPISRAAGMSMCSRCRSRGGS